MLVDDDDGDGASVVHGCISPQPTLPPLLSVLFVLLSIDGECVCACQCVCSKFMLFSGLT